MAGGDRGVGSAEPGTRRCETTRVRGQRHAEEHPTQHPATHASLLSSCLLCAGVWGVVNTFASVVATPRRTGRCAAVPCARDRVLTSPAVPRRPSERGAPAPPGG